jgi:hypothetical protein
MAEIVYIMGAALSALCAALLIRGYARSGYRLLLWSGLCFVGLALNNVTLFLDLVVFADGPDLSLPRLLSAVGGLSLLLYGLLWEAG